MFYYNRQIVYMDLWKAGERAGNAGFLKLEETDRRLRWQMRIRGLGESDTGFFDLRDETGALVDKILLQKGEGSYERTMEPGATTRGGRLFREICGLRAELPGGRYLKGTWKLSGRGTELPKPAMPEISVPETPLPKASAPEMVPPEGSMAERFSLKAPVLETPPAEKEIPVPERTCCPKGRCLQAAGTPVSASMDGRTSPQTADSPAPPTAAGARTAPPRAKEAVRRQSMCRAAPEEEGKGVIHQTFYEDKWEQLQHMYPKVHPFGDERMFLSITPGDFVILGREYQKLVHNSFLLHGYYNYRHVILGRYPDEEGESYYLGVPGVYYEREKMAAEMFGFEAFEGKREPAQQGDFGYYMKRVRI